MTQPPGNEWNHGGWTPPPPQNPGQNPAQGPWQGQPQGPRHAQPTQNPWQGQPQGPWQPQSPQGPWQGQPQGQPQGQWQDLTTGQWSSEAHPSEPWAPQPPAKPRRRAGLIASLAAVVVVAGGGAATYVALSSSSSTGASSPKQAVQGVIGAMQKSDLVGVLNDLAPGERDAFSGPLRDDITSLKTLKVVKPDANPGSVSAVTFRANDLTYADKTITINDHVQIVQLTGGSIDVHGDAAKWFTTRFLDASGGSTSMLQGSQHVDLAKEISASGKPIRIATVKVGGRWYPSIFYTVADQAANGAVPQASDAIPATGASSGEQAVREMVDTLLRGDLRSAIGLISPSELGALHDYGGMLIRKSGGTFNSTGETIKSLELTSTPISGGAQRIGLKRIVLGNSRGEQVTVVLDGGCVETTANGHSQRLCSAQLSQYLPLFGSSSTCTSTSSSPTPVCTSKQPSAAQKQALTDVFSAFTKFGVVTTQTGGKWYVAPVRTVTDLGSTLLSSLKGDDLFQLMKLGG